MVYLSKDNAIIVDGIEAAVNGKKCVIDISDEARLKAYRLSELTTLGETFAFICNHYPGYDRSDEVSCLDDLDCLIGGECDEEKTERLTADWGSDPDVWQEERDKIYSALIRGAVENYKNTNNFS